MYWFYISNFSKPWRGITQGRGALHEHACFDLLSCFSTWQDSVASCCIWCCKWSWVLKDWKSMGKLCRFYADTSHTTLYKSNHTCCNPWRAKNQPATDAKGNRGTCCYDQVWKYFRSHHVNGRNQLVCLAGSKKLIITWHYQSTKQRLCLTTKWPKANCIWKMHYIYIKCWLSSTSPHNLWMAELTGLPLLHLASKVHLQAFLGILE